MVEIMRVRAVLSGWSPGAPGLTTFYFRPGTASGSTADATDCAARVRTFFAAVGIHLPSTTTVNVSGQVDVLEATTGTLTGSFSGGSPAPVIGVAGGDVMPQMVMGLIRLHTGDIHHGRKIQGRSFFGPLPETTATALGLPTTTFRSDLVTAANAMLSGTTPSTMRVWSRPGSPPGDPGLDAQVLSFSVATVFSVLRSRRDG